MTVNLFLFSFLLRLNKGSLILVMLELKKVRNEGTFRRVLSFPEQVKGKDKNDPSG